MVPSRIIFLFAVLFLFTLNVAGTAKAAPEYSKIVYEESTGSYFQYVLYPVGNEQNWVTVRQLAAGLSYKGIRGRLAVVPSRKVGDFLRRTFKPKTRTWIGLRYFCEFRKLMWVTSRLLDRTGYQNWDPQWYLNPNATCSTQNTYMDFMPVYYTPNQAGFRWRASGMPKKFYGLFVEYPKPG